MPLEPGRRLGPYEVLGALGAGGMGEVYRARDTRLGRDVALKILPESLAGDPERRRRFEREARAVAALNHPGVLALYDVGETDGVGFMVSEVLEGETLRTRLGRGSVPWERAVEWGAEIAEALAATHERGIVHRDLKPGNLFVSRDGRIKILDFGLAKELPAATPREDPTLTDPTGAGHILGTAGYLSPEQARGQPVDGRSDLFALGCVLYEVLAGRRAFGGQDIADHIAAVLTSDPPDVASVRADVPAPVSRLVQRCLAKERTARFQSASDLAFALRSMAPGAAAPVPEARRRRRSRPAWLLAFGLAGLAAGYWLRPTSEVPAPTVLALTPGTNREVAPAISPDGKFVAYLASEGGRTDLWVKFVGGGPGVNLTAKSGLMIAGWGLPEISPDGSAIAVRAFMASDTGYFQQGIWLIPAPLGGPARKLVDRAGALRWSPDGKQIVYMLPDPASGDTIVLARADGAEERVVVPRTQGLHVHDPAFSSDGAWVYYTRGLKPDEAPVEIWRVPSGGGAGERVVATLGLALSPQPTPDGDALIYAGDQMGGALNLWWRPLGGGRERRLTQGGGDYVTPRISRDGRRLVCENRTSVGSLRVVDVEKPASGIGQVLTGAGAGDAAPSTARTGRMAFSSARNGTPDIWISDAAGANSRPLTSDFESDASPALSPDGTRVAFISNRAGRRGLWLVAAEGGTPRPLVAGEVADPPSWSPDGQRLVYAAEGQQSEVGLWIISADGGTPTALPGVRGRRPVWSRNADLIAYVTSEGGSTRLLRRFTSSGGERRLGHLDLSGSGDSAFSWNGRWFAQAVAPANTNEEIVVVDLASGGVRTAVRLDTFMNVAGVAWSSDDTRLVYGLRQYQSRVLLFDGLTY